MSMVMAGAALALAAVTAAAKAAKAARKSGEGIQSPAWATAADVRGWGLVGDARLDALHDGRRWPTPAFVYGSMGKRSDIVFDWTAPGASRHALVSAPSGAGKTWTVFYPTLLYGWTHSAVVHVRKKEMAEWTAGFRASFGDVIWLDPTSLGSAKYNPLDRVRATGIFAIRDAQNLIERLAASSGGDGEGGANAVFLETAKDFSSTALVYVLTHVPVSRRNFSGLRHAFADCAALAAAMLSNEHPHPHVRAEIRIAAQALLSNPSERFVGNVEGLMRSWLRVYQDTVLAHVTSRSDFAPADLVRGERPVTLYIHLPPSDDRRLAPFVNLLVSQILDDLMTWESVTRDGDPKRWWLGWILDEAWRLGKIEALEGALADMRSYRMRALLGFQGLSQVIDLYGLHNSVFNNCRWITSWQNGYDECKRVAEMLGEEERDKESRSVSYGALGDLGGRSVTASSEWRPVVQAAHVSRLPKDRIIVFGEEKPILAHRTDQDTWKPLVRAIERPERIVGAFVTGPTPAPREPALAYLRRLLPGWAGPALLPPPDPPPGPEGSGGDGDRPDADGPAPGAGPQAWDHRRPRRGRKRLF